MHGKCGKIVFSNLIGGGAGGHLPHQLFTKICLYTQRLFLKEKLKPSVEILDFDLRIL